MNILDLEMELDEIGLLFFLEDEYGTSWEVSPSIICESDKRFNLKPGLYLDVSYAANGEIEDWHEDDYITRFLVQIIKTPIGFVLSDTHRKVMEKQNGKSFFEFLEYKLNWCKLRLVFLFPQV